MLSLNVSCLAPNYKSGLSFYILGEKIMLIEPIVNNHIADSDAGYGRLGNLAFLLKENKKSEQNGRKHLTETKVLAI